MKRLLVSSFVFLCIEKKQVSCGSTIFQEKSCVPVSNWQRESGTEPLPGESQRENKINSTRLNNGICKTYIDKSCHLHACIFSYVLCKLI